MALRIFANSLETVFKRGKKSNTEPFFMNSVLNCNEYKLLLESVYSVVFKDL